MASAHRWSAILALLAIASAEPALAAGITKETLKIDRDVRTYYMFVPESLGSEPAPLLITLHGSGRDGRPLVDLFRDIASKERFIVVGPDATDRRGWQAPADGPAFLYFLIEAVKAKRAVDGRRMYLFGHSAGASFALTMGLAESEFFAAAAVHAARMTPEDQGQLPLVPRKLPIVLFHGTSDSVVPILSGREARDALTKAGFPAELHELPGFEHNTLYTRGYVIAPQVWEFLKGHALDEDPRYQVYSYQKH
jgi:poly(3-hydroxybutyrate) depolymerase